MVLKVRKKKVQIWGLAIKSYLQQWEGEKDNKKLFHITDLPPTQSLILAYQVKKETQLISQAGGLNLRVRHL